MRQVSATLALAAFVGIVACSDDDVPRSDVTLFSLNGGDPVQSDVISYDEDGNPYVVEDEIWVVFQNVPSDLQGTMGAAGAFSNVTLDRYRVSFETDPATPLDTYEGGMHAVVVSGDTTGVAVVLVPAEMKTRTPLVELQTGLGQVLSTAHLEFWGEEKTSGDNIYVDGYMVVNFGNFGDAQ